MTVLVTGASGFIGSHLCRDLVREGQAVRAFHRANSSPVNLQGLPVEHVIGDITQPASLQAAMYGVQAVFHTAAQLGRPRHPDQMYTVTVEGTRNVLQAAGEAGVSRVVHTSSVAALGVPALPHAKTAPIEMNENHTWNFSPEWWRYGHAKYLAELAVQEAVAKGLEVVIVNPAVVIGAGDLHQISGNVVIQVARGRLPVAIPGGLNIVHIEDVIRGHIAALAYGRTGERYILGGENMSHLHFLRLTAKIAGVPPPRFIIPGRLARWLAPLLAWIDRRLPLPVAGDALRRAGNFFYYDTRKAREQLGLTEPRPASEAIAEAYSWYLEQGIIRA